MPDQSEESRKKRGMTGVAIPAGLFLGMGFGFLVDNIPAGISIGLGSGFLGVLIFRVILGDW